MRWVKPQSLYLQLLLFLGLPLLLLWGLSAFNRLTTARCYPLPEQYRSGWRFTTAGWA